VAPQTEVLLIAVVVAAACALPGVFLVLRQMSLMSDAISHSVLLGIVIGFFITGRLDSPLLLILAAGTGVLTVSLVDYCTEHSWSKKMQRLVLFFQLCLV